MEIFVGNLPFEITEEQIKDKFAECGEVSNVRMLTDKRTGRFRGIAFVSFVNDDDARNALDNFNGVDLGGRPMRIEKDKGIDHRFNGFGGSFAPKKKFAKKEFSRKKDFTRKDFPKKKFSTHKKTFKKREDFNGFNAEEKQEKRSFFKPFKNSFNKFKKRFTKQK